MRSFLSRRKSRRRKRLKLHVLRFSKQVRSNKHHSILTPHKVNEPVSFTRKPLKIRRLSPRINNSSIDNNNHYRRPLPSGVVSGPTPCQKRKVRRSVLFATGKYGSNPGPRKWDNSSFERCVK